MLREHELKTAAKECLENYFEEDRKIMIDESIMRIKSIMFYIYDLIYFGNKIIISKQTLEKIKDYSKRKYKRIMSDNSQYLLENMKRDKYGNYEIVDISKEDGNTSAKKLGSYLAKNKHVMYFLESKKHYEKLAEMGLKEQLKLLDFKMKVTSLCKSKSIKFITIGAIEHKNGKMFLSNRPGDTVFKVYDNAGKEKKGEVVEVEVNDIVLIRSNKNMIYSFNLCKVITQHSRNQAINIIWTDIAKGHKTNFYVERLEDKYRKMILDNSN